MPGAATTGMFAKDTKRDGHKVVGVPGTVRGLELAHKTYGKLPWKSVVQPANAEGSVAGLSRSAVTQLIPGNS